MLGQMIDGAIVNEKYDALADVVASEIDAGRPAVFRLAEIDVERAGVARRLADLVGQRARADAQLINLVGSAPDMTPPLMIPADWAGDAKAFHLFQVAEAGVDISEARIDQAKTQLARARIAVRRLKCLLAMISSLAW
jgi:outer membrane protein TolC